MLERHYKNLTDDDSSYGDYKKSFAFIAQFFGLPKEEIIIEWLEFEEPKNNEPAKVALRYSKGLHKVQLPPDVRLIHIAPVDNITELNPSFRSKVKGKFMYPSKRVFFTVGKAINPFKNGMVTSKNPITQLKQRSELKSYKYTTKADKFSAVYIDPTYNQVGDSSVMIITEKPIPVMKFQDKMEQIFASLKKILPGGKKKEESKKEEEVTEESFINGSAFDLDAFMEAATLSTSDFRRFMSDCTKNFPEQYRKGMSRFEEDEEEELEDFLQGYSKTLAVGYFDCRRISRNQDVIVNEITPAIRKFCKEMTNKQDTFKLYISEADGYDIFLDLKRKEVSNNESSSWYDAEAMELLESFDIDYEVVDEGAIKDFIETIKAWKTSNEDHSKRVFRSNSVSDEDYEKLSKIIETLKDPEVKFGPYSKAFKELCTYCHTIPTGTIITKYELKKGDKDQNSINVEYAENTKKIKLPDGIKLFHISKVPNISKLIPQFKGKSERGYLYDKPRIYFTVNKYMPKFLADYKGTDKLYKYECKQDINEVYVDPLVWSISQGAVYVETNTDIPVEEVKDNIVTDVVDKINPLKKDEEKKEDNENTNDEEKK